MTEDEARETKLDVDKIPLSQNPSEFVKAGINGDVSLLSMAERYRRIESRKRSQGYREVTPCCKCLSCAEFREFEGGELRVKSYVCLELQTSVKRYATCDHARGGEDEKRKIFVDMTGAPSDMPRDRDMALEMLEAVTAEKTKSILARQRKSHIEKYRRHVQAGIKRGVEEYYQETTGDAHYADRKDK